MSECQCICVCVHVSACVGVHVCVTILSSKGSQGSMEPSNILRVREVRDSCYEQSPSHVCAGGERKEGVMQESWEG